MSRRKKEPEAPVAEPGIGSLYWHLHHEVLAEPLTQPLEDRLSYIRDHKSQFETPAQIAHRLKLIKPVIGPVPEALTAAMAEHVTALTEASALRATSTAAWDAFVAAREAWEKSRVPAQDFTAPYDAYPPEVETLRQAWLDTQRGESKLWQRAGLAERAARELTDQHAAELKALHAVECPGCTWDGFTIFSQAFKAQTEAVPA